MRRAPVLLCAFLLLFAATAMRAFAQGSTPEPAAPTDEVVPFGDDTYAFVSSGYVSLFVVTDQGVIATDPASQFDTDRVNRYKAAIESVTDQPVRYLVYSHDHADHAIGGAVFADTATFVSHRNAVEKIAAIGDPNTPVPTIAFDDYLALTLGDTTIELYHAGRNRSDNSVVLYHAAQRLVFAVDFVPVDSMPFRNLPDFYLPDWLDSLSWVEENLDFDTLVPGHPPVTGTESTVGEVRGYVEDLIEAIDAARAEGLADNSPEMVEAVRAALEPEYGTWANFEEYLPLNIEGAIRLQGVGDGTPEA